jgi:ribosomal protein L37E
MFAASEEPVYNGPAMNEDGRSQSEALLRCPRCGSSHDREDNFCRHCGAALQASRVPMVRDEGAYAPVPWREAMPVVVRGAAVVAAGTLAEAVLRRLIARALRGSARPSDQPVRQAGQRARLPARRQPERAEVVERPGPAGDDDHVVSETFLFRRVRLRHRDWAGE